jgi:hypothetical protein
MKEKPIGGKRNGAGRKKSANPKRPVTIFVETLTVDSYGGKDGLRLFLYEAIDRHKSAYPEAFEKRFPIPDAEIKEKGIKKHDLPKVIISDLAKPTSVLKPQEQPKTNYSINTSAPDNEAILKQIEAIKTEKIPKERDTPIGRRVWASDQWKRVDELKKQLK